VGKRGRLKCRKKGVGLEVGKRGKGEGVRVEKGVGIEMEKGEGLRVGKMGRDNVGGRLGKRVGKEKELEVKKRVRERG
jgi:hypothetical protein